MPRITKGLNDDSGDGSDDEDYEPPNESESDDNVSLADDVPIDDLRDDEVVEIVDGYESGAGCEWSDPIDGEDYFDKMYANGEMYKKQAFRSIKLKPWMLFADKKHFKMVFIKYCIQEGFCVVVSKTDKTRYTAQYGGIECPFRIHASVMPDGHTFAIKSLTPTHDCIRLTESNPMTSFKWCAYKVLDLMRANNDTSLDGLNEALLQRFGIILKKSIGYNMRTFALSLLHGGHDESCLKLPTYCEVIKETKPGSIAHCVWVNIGDIERPLVFKNIFISFAAEMQGLLSGCRGLIEVGGAHLKGSYSGVLLSAVALDANNEIFPVAHGVYDSENKESWSSFLYHLKGILTSCDRDDWTIIFYRQKGILPALDDIWPTVPRRFCARHLLANFKKEFPGPLMYALFWRVVNAYSDFSFNKAMTSMQKHGGIAVVQWF